MKLNTRKLTIVIVFAALYAVGVIALAPISFGAFQVRIADALLPLSMIFGLPGAIGFAIGCAVSNIYSPFGLIDVVGGAAANLIACCLAWYIGRGKHVTFRFIGTVAETLTVSIIVGGYLYLLFGVPLEAGFLGILAGSIVAINVLGFPIQEAIRKSRIFANLNGDKKAEKPKPA
jgi:uncharacterized membrane protein